ncbi:MAG: hypothetical protein QM753_12815 [Thermomicrobiales bacterium]
MMKHHYDPAYDRSSRKDGRARLARIELADLGQAAQEEAAATIARLVAAHRA